MYFFRDKIHKVKATTLLRSDVISTLFFHLWLALVCTCYDTSFTLADAIITEYRDINMYLLILLTF